MSRPRPPVRPALDDTGRLLATRQYCAMYAARTVDQVRRGCAPVACAVPSRQPLYDLDEVIAAFAGTPRRQARHSGLHTVA